MGLSQQRLADLMDIKRGKVAGYFYETQAKPEFYEKLGEKFQLNIGKFLTVEMSDDNYDSFFTGASVDNHTDGVAESPGEYQKKSKVLDLLIQVKNSEDLSERDQLLDEIIKLYGKVLDENSKLKDANSELKDRLLEMAKKLIRN
ncbi:hypothetical protein [Ekhidna sp.]